jgi:phosphoglycolate phosphatase
VSGLPVPKAVLFDWDSTLVDNWGGITRAMAVVFETHGLDAWDEPTVRANAKKSMRDSFPALFGDRWEEAASLFYESFAAVHLETLRPLDGAVDLLQCLRDTGVPLGVVSNKNGAFLRSEVTHLGWAPLFHRIVGATDAPNDKPATDPVHMALEGTGVAAGAEVWFVGDSAVDLACAHASGCVPVLLHPDDPHPEDLSGHPPALHVAGCTELLAQLRG